MTLNQIILRITIVKTTDSLIINLNDYSRAILKKHKEILFENNNLLPVKSNQKINDYINELARINEPIKGLVFC